MVIETRLEYRGYVILIGAVEGLTRRIYKAQIGCEEQGHFVPKLLGFAEELSRAIEEAGAMAAAQRRAQTTIDHRLRITKERALSSLLSDARQTEPGRSAFEPRSVFGREFALGSTGASSRDQMRARLDPPARDVPVLMERFVVARQLAANRLNG